MSLDSSLAPLVDVLRGRRVCVLTGAGLSTESGIPDYRGPQTRHKPRNPIQHQAFVRDPAVRARYWARSALGWPRFRAFEPNPAHRALAHWAESSDSFSGLITQNVDRLHHKAGSRDVVELHGALHEVRCLACRALTSRDAMQERLEALNPALAQWSFELAPDGDAEPPPEALAGFQVPDCEACGGVLKPDVVFFGDHVPAPRVDEAFGRLFDADVLLVVGSSLAVYSGYRFVLRAVERRMPVAVINLGESRADAQATVRVEAPAGLALPALVAALGNRGVLPS